jgi:hypothetical protein
VHFVEAAVLAHPVRQALRAGAVGIGEVGDGELAALGITRVAVLGQALGPVPHLVAERGLDAELVGEAQLDDTVDVAQAFGEFVIDRMFEPALEGGDDFALPQPGAARAAHREDEGKAELGVVVGVELLDLGELVGRAVGEARLALLVGGLGRQRLADHRLAGQFRVGADQRELRLAPGLAHDLRQRELQVRQAGERAQRGGALGDPRRVFVAAVEQGDEFARARRVQLFNRHSHR